MSEERTVNSLCACSCNIDSLVCSEQVGEAGPEGDGYQRIEVRVTSRFYTRVV